MNDVFSRFTNGRARQRVGRPSFDSLPRTGGQLFPKEALMNTCAGPGKTVAAIKKIRDTGLIDFSLTTPSFGGVKCFPLKT